MEKRKLGRTNLNITQLGFGAMEIRGKRIWNGRVVTDKQAETILNAVLDSGINFIDTSYDYGKSEEYIGKYISTRRSEYYLATKCGCHLIDKGDHDETIPHVWTKENLLHNIEESLKRMKTDYIDIWQLHNPTPEQVEQGDLITVMEKVKESGKIGHVSVSSNLPDIKTFIKWDVFDSFQIPYSALQREHENIICMVAEKGAGTIIRGGVGRGDPEQSGAPNVNLWKNWDKANLDELLEQGQGRTDFMLRFTISHPDIHTTIVGTVNPDHLQSNLKAFQEGSLPDNVYNEAKSRLDAIGIRPSS
jgi:aryl-alcohol dehydrogenase-like predicted oxidoreductase